MQTYRYEYDGDLFAPAKDVHLFDTSHLQADLGLDLWDHSQWKASKEIAETMLLCMKEANSMVLLNRSKLCSLKALITILTLYEEDVSSPIEFSSLFAGHILNLSAGRTTSIFYFLFFVNVLFLTVCI